VAVLEGSGAFGVVHGLQVYVAHDAVEQAPATGGAVVEPAVLAGGLLGSPVELGQKQGGNEQRTDAGVAGQGKGPR